MTKKEYNHFKLVRDTHRGNPEIDLEVIKKIVKTVEGLIMQRERLNEETIEEQEQVKCDYCGRNIDDCDCL